MLQCGSVSLCEISVFQCVSVSVFQCFMVSVFQCFSVSVVQCFSVSVFPCCSISVFQCFCVFYYNSVTFWTLPDFVGSALPFCFTGMDPWTQHPKPGEFWIGSAARLFSFKSSAMHGRDRILD